MVQLAWQPVEGATGYFVFRDGSERPLNLTPLQDASYLDIGLTNGRTYTYQIVAIDENGLNGPRSEPVEATPE